MLTSQEIIVSPFLVILLANIVRLYMENCTIPGRDSIIG